MTLCPNCHLPPHEGCSGSGFLDSDAPCPSLLAFRASQAKERRLAECVVPERYLEATASNYRVEGSRNRARVRASCVSWWTEWGTGRPERGVLLHGGNGSGKSHLACALLSGVVRTYGVTGRFVSLPALSVAMKERVGENRNATDLTAPLVSVDLVVFDELGTTKRSEWVDDVLYYLLNERYARKLPVIVTSEWGLEELRSKIPGRLVSRLYEAVEPISFEGIPDYRRSKPSPSA